MNWHEKRSRAFDEALICEQYRELRSTSKVAALHGTHAGKVNAILRQHGIVPTQRSRFDENEAAIVADYLAGKLSMLEMEAKYGFSCDQMRNKLKARGLYDPKRKDAFVNRKSQYDCWVISLGQEGADKRLAEYLTNHKRTRPRGAAHERYGKPSHQGTGNGWKGWYRGHYFRSLREACCMLSLDQAGVEWQPGETLSIPYTFLGVQRTYRPDYVVGTQLLEVKPTRLHDTPRVSAKRVGAEAYCATKGLTYELVDVAIDAEAVYEAWTTGLVRFDRDYESRFLAYVGIHSA